MKDRFDKALLELGSTFPSPDPRRREEFLRSLPQEQRDRTAVPLLHMRRKPLWYLLPAAAAAAVMLTVGIRAYQNHPPHTIPSIIVETDTTETESMTEPVSETEAFGAIITEAVTSAMQTTSAARTETTNTLLPASRTESTAITSRSAQTTVTTPPVTAAGTKAATQTRPAQTTVKQSVPAAQSSSRPAQLAGGTEKSLAQTTTRPASAAAVRTSAPPSATTKKTTQTSATTRITATTRKTTQTSATTRTTATTRKTTQTSATTRTTTPPVKASQTMAPTTIAPTTVAPTTTAPTASASAALRTTTMTYTTSRNAQMTEFYTTTLKETWPMSAPVQSETTWVQTTYAMTHATESYTEAYTEAYTKPETLPDADPIEPTQPYEAADPIQEETNYPYPEETTQYETRESETPSTADSGKYTPVTLTPQYTGSDDAPVWWEFAGQYPAPDGQPSAEVLLGTVRKVYFTVVDGLPYTVMEVNAASVLKGSHSANGTLTVLEPGGILPIEELLKLSSSVQQHYQILSQSERDSLSDVFERNDSIPLPEKGEVYLFRLQAESPEGYYLYAKSPAESRLFNRFDGWYTYDNRRISEDELLQ